MVVCGKSFCTSPFHAGPRWILALNFSVDHWKDADKTIPHAISSWCNACHRLYRRTYRRQLVARGVLVDRDKEDPRLPIDPFALWLAEKSMKLSNRQIAAAVGCDESRVRLIVKRIYVKHGCRYVARHIRYSTVERFLMAFGEDIHMLYDFDEIERAAA